jgi:hypothetical protein
MGWVGQGWGQREICIFVLLGEEGRGGCTTGWTQQHTHTKSEGKSPSPIYSPPPLPPPSQALEAQLAEELLQQEAEYLEALEVAEEKLMVAAFEEAACAGGVGGVGGGVGWGG